MRELISLWERTLGAPPENCLADDFTRVAFSPDDELLFTRGVYDDRVCSLCRGMGVLKPFEAVTDEDEPGPEVAELTVVEEQVPVAGQDDPEPEEQEESGDEIAEEGLTEVEVE